MAFPSFSATTPDFFAAWLIHDYLGTVGSITAGVPSEATLPAHVMDQGNETPCPCRITAAREMQGSTQARKVLMISVILRTVLKADDAAAATITGQLTRAEASAIIRAIDDRLRDRASFEAWLLTLPEARIAGWTLISHAPQSMPPCHREPLERRYDYAAVLHLTLASAAQTPDPSP